MLLLRTCSHFQHILVCMWHAEMAADTTESLDDLQSIADKLRSIARLSAEYHLRLSTILHSGSSCNIAGTLYTCLTHDMDPRLWVYECYSTSFTNALVCGTFDKLVKTNKCVAFITAALYCVYLSIFSFNYNFVRLSCNTKMTLNPFLCGEVLLRYSFTPLLLSSFKMNVNVCES